MPELSVTNMLAILFFSDNFKGKSMKKQEKKT